MNRGAAPTLGQAAIRTVRYDPRRDKLFFDLDGLGWLPPGAALGYLDRLASRGDRVEARLDNVLTVAILVHLFELGFAGTALFSAEEEAGRSWRYVRDWYLREGCTELGRQVEGSNGTITGATLQVPTIGDHTQEESAALQSVEAMLAFLHAWGEGRRG